MITTRSLKRADFSRGTPARMSLTPTLFPSPFAGGSRQRLALSEQEIIVAGLLADGLSSRDIEGNLQISPSHVGNVITSLHFKLGVRTRSELSSALAELE